MRMRLRRGVSAGFPTVWPRWKRWPRPMIAAGPIFGVARRQWPTFYLVPQMYNARRFGVEMDAFATIVAADAAARAHPAFEAARPENQPDAPEDGH